MGVGKDLINKIMKIITIKDSCGSEVIHSYTSENATIRDAVEDAVKKSISLKGADLRGADLRFSSLDFADLRFARLESADLTGSTLRNSLLKGANLHSANLHMVDVSDKNLFSARKVPLYCYWEHGINNGNIIVIGAYEGTIEWWEKFFEDLENNPHEKEKVPMLHEKRAVFEAYKAYLTFLNK